MYSVILAAMLSGGAQQTQAWHPVRGSCYGSSCYGSSCYGSCYGSCSGSCFGSTVSHGGLFSRLHSHSCHGSCYGSSSYGCNGFTGYSVGYSYWATGCYGSSCFGGCYGTAGIGCFGWTGGFATAPIAGAPQFTSGEMVQPGTSAPVSGGTTYVPPSSNPPAPSPVVPPAAPIGEKVPESPLPNLPKVPGIDPLKQINAIDNNSATVIVYVPADAKLWVDRVVCPLAGTVRTFNTPVLIPGAEYSYTIIAEMPNGSREERRVNMSAGRTVEVDFRGMGIETVSK